MNDSPGDHSRPRPRPVDRPAVGRHGLGPHAVGRRVVIRRVLRGETGPTGGPAFTDLLGVMESWDGEVTTIRSEDGDLTTIRVADIVSGKPVPPRPSVRHRVSAEDAERRALATWPPLEAAPLGDWVLRASGGFSARANSVLAVGDPGMRFGAATDTVRDFYESRGLPAWVQVVVGSDVHLAFESAGWVLARPGEDDTAFQIASVSKALRAVRRSLPPDVSPVSTSTTVSPAWLADDQSALSCGDAAVAVLEGTAEVAFAAVTSPASAPLHTVAATDAAAAPEAVVAKGRAACADDWVGLSNVWVSPDRRRRGLAMAVLGTLLEWAAERGATTAFVQTRGDNPAALSLYERLGFLTHHTYRYLTDEPRG